MSDVPPWSAFEPDPALARMEREPDPAPLAVVTPIRPPAPVETPRFRVHPFGGEPEDAVVATVAFERAAYLGETGVEVAIEKLGVDDVWRPVSRRPIVHVEADLWPRGLAVPVAWTSAKEPKPTHFAVHPDGYRVIRGEIPLPPLTRRPVTA